LLIEVCGADLAEVGATVAELIDTIEGCGDAAFRLRPGGTASDRRVLWTWHGWNANVLVQLPAVDAHQRVAGLKLAERRFRVPPVRNLKIIT